MTSSSHVAALLLSAALAPAAPPIGPDAVWKPPADFRSRVDKKCKKAADFGACFVAQMQAAGASADAVAFARRTDNQGYATRYRDTGIVDMINAEYPFRANENFLVLLVNGQPPMVDVDDTSLLDKEALAANTAYSQLLAKYPGLAFFPTDRRMMPGAAPLRSGGQRFVVTYQLRDGCHACAVVGDARIGFDFDVEGKFVETKVMRIRKRGTF